MNRYIIRIAYGVVGVLLGMRLGAALWLKESESSKIETVPDIVWRCDHFELNKENVYRELLIQKVDFPKIVLAQAILETGNFKSYGCLTRNNLFGLRKKDGDYMSFEHWTFSVAAYKMYIQKYSHPPNDYYKFLSDLGYAEDPNYINKLKGIVSRNDKRRSEQLGFV